MSREGEIPSWSSAPSCSAESRTAPHIFASLRHRSRVTIKPCSPSAAFHGEAGVFRRYVLPLIAARCLANPRCALHRLPIVPSSRLKLGLNSFRRCMSREGGNHCSAQFCAISLLNAMLCSILFRHRSRFTIKTLLISPQSGINGFGVPPRYAQHCSAPPHIVQRVTAPPSSVPTNNGTSTFSGVNP